MPTSRLLAGQVIGILTDGPGARPIVTQQALEAEIRSLTRGEYDVSFPANKQLNGNWNAIGISAALDQLLNNPDVDIILCLGVLSSQESVLSSHVAVVAYQSAMFFLMSTNSTKYRSGPVGSD